MKEFHFDVYGKVQGVMFRQTLMRGAIKRDLYAAASNDRDDRNHVFCFLKGDSQLCQEMMKKLASGMKLNNWGAQVETLSVATDASERDPDVYEVNTENVDDINWSEGVEFYL